MKVSWVVLEKVRKDVKSWALSWIGDKLNIGQERGTTEKKWITDNDTLLL